MDTTTKIEPQGQLSAPRLKMADIARMAGVSVSTVSRALAGSPLIPQTLRDRINALADEQGYVVNHAARNLRLKTTRTIGMVLPDADDDDLRDAQTLALVGALTEAVFRRGYELLLLKMDRDRAGSLKDMVQSQRFDGLLVVAEPDPAQHTALNALSAHYLPLVVWGQKPDQTYCGVTALDPKTPLSHVADAMVDRLFRRLNGDPAPSVTV